MKSDLMQKGFELQDKSMEQDMRSLAEATAYMDASRTLLSGVKAYGKENQKALTDIKQQHTNYLKGAVDKVLQSGGSFIQLVPVMKISYQSLQDDLSSGKLYEINRHYQQAQKDIESFTELARKGTDQGYPPIYQQYAMQTIGQGLTAPVYQDLDALAIEYMNSEASTGKDPALLRTAIAQKLINNAGQHLLIQSGLWDEKDENVRKEKLVQAAFAAADNAIATNGRLSKQQQAEILNPITSGFTTLGGTTTAMGAAVPYGGQTFNGPFEVVTDEAGQPALKSKKGVIAQAWDYVTGDAEKEPTKEEQETLANINKAYETYKKGMVAAGQEPLPLNQYIEGMQGMNHFQVKMASSEEQDDNYKRITNQFMDPKSASGFWTTWRIFDSEGNEITEDREKVFKDAIEVLEGKDPTLPVATECGAGLSRVRAPGVGRVLSNVIPGATAATGLLVLLNGVCFLVMLAVPFAILGRETGSLFGFDPGTLLRYGSGFSLLTFGNGEWWRLVTPMFLHGGLLHFAMNTMVLLQLGPLAEEEYGTERFATIHLLTGIASTFGSQAFRILNMVGASGALCGLLGLMLVHGIRRGGAYGNALKRVMIQNTLLMLVISFLPGIDFVAHLSGFVVGFVLGWVVPYGAIRNRVGAFLWDLAPIAGIVLILWAFWRMAVEGPAGALLVLGR